MRYGVYVRLSKTDDDRAVSLDQQSEACRRYVADQGGTIALEAQDIQSGLDPERPGYQTILQAARDRRIDSAVVWRWDRWGRDTLEALRSFHELSGLDVEVHSVSEGSGDPFLRDLMLLLANRESRVISARVKPVLRMQAEMGRWQTRPPTGYDLVDGRLKPNSQAPLIRTLFKRASRGESVSSVKRWAQQAGLTSPSGRPPSRSTVHAWLRNIAYTGAVHYNRTARGRFERHRKRPESEWIIVPDAHPGIVGKETFGMVQAILSTHKQFQARVRGSKWLLTGRVYCAYCGSRMYAHKSGSGHVYSCYKGSDYGGCVQKNTRGKPLDAWAKEQISGLAITPEIRQRAREIIKAEAEQGITEWQQRRHSLSAAYGRHQETRQKLARRVMAEAIPPDVYRRLEEEEATALHAIERELSKQEAPPPTPDLAPILDVLETLTWDSLDDEAWREVIALLMERVDVLGRGDYRLTWTDVGASLARVLERV